MSRMDDLRDSLHNVLIAREGDNVDAVVESILDDTIKPLLEEVFDRVDDAAFGVDTKGIREEMKEIL